MTATPHDEHLRGERRGPALGSQASAFGLRRRTVATSAGRLVVRSGEAAGDTALILLHGAAGSWTTWTPLLRAAQRSGATLEDVIAVDLPGWGESSPSTSSLDIATLSRAVCEVAQESGYRRWIVVGHSLGGFLALDIAARTPTETQGVALVSPSGAAVLDAIRRPVRGGVALPGFAGMLLAMRVLADMGALGRSVVRAIHRAGMLRAFSSPLFADPAHVHHTVIDALADEVRPAAFADAARAAAGYDESIWRNIACPVRAMRGERDVFVGDADARAFAELIGDFAQTTVRSTGHFAHVERPEAVLPLLRTVAGNRALAGA